MQTHIDSVSSGGGGGGDPDGIVTMYFFYFNFYLSYIYTNM